MSVTGKQREALRGDGVRSGPNCLDPLAEPCALTWLAPGLLPTRRAGRPGPEGRARGAFGLQCGLHPSRCAVRAEAASQARFCK